MARVAGNYVSYWKRYRLIPRLSPDLQGIQALSPHNLNHRPSLLRGIPAPNGLGKINTGLSSHLFYVGLLSAIAKVKIIEGGSALWGSPEDLQSGRRLVCSVLCSQR